MIQIKKPYKLTKIPIEVQVGRTILRINTLRPGGIFAWIASCFGKKQQQVSGIAEKIQNESYDSEALQEQNSHILDIHDDSDIENAENSDSHFADIEVVAEYEEFKDSRPQSESQR